MSKIKTFLFSKLLEYVLTGIIPICSFIASKLLTNLDEKVESNFSNWYKINSGFFWLFLFIILLTTWLVVNKLYSSKKDTQLNIEIENLKQIKADLENNISSLKEINKGIEKENSLLKDSFGYISRDYYQRIGDLLKAIFADSKLSLTVDDRISIYRHIDDLNMFFMLGRYSKNSDFRKNGRMLYPDNIGFIGKAWQQNEDLLEKDLPDYTTNPEDYLKEILNKSGLDCETTTKLGMKGRYIFITKLLRSDNVTPDMIVVFESMKPHRLNKSKLQRIMAIHLPELQAQVNIQTPYEPSEEYAELMGFGK